VVWRVWAWRGMRGVQRGKARVKGCCWKLQRRQQQAGMLGCRAGRRVLGLNKAARVAGGRPPEKSGLRIPVAPAG
jgi:hypothetical protein